MNVFTNEAFFTQQIQAARRRQAIGVVLMVFYFLTSGVFLFISGSALPPAIVSILYPLGLVALLIGFPMWRTSTSKLKRLQATPRADSLLNNELKGLNNKYALHHYVPADGGI